MNLHIILFYIGILIILGSHIYMLWRPTKPIVSMEVHAYTNLLAGIFILYYFMNKQGYITF
jgi:hypothetical protein